ncbi:hypothetical protein COO60DRAFT_75930 [Scenedesmus sp. NREL 46B-D3]|nr:hypothetical protein COO60DRAFT_75930 [Scenedesmus sp. NREL 46B-D3]
MQAAALIAAKRKKLAAAAAAAGEGGATDQDEQGPAKKQRLGGPEPVDDAQVYQQALQQQAAMHATSTQQQAPSGRVLAKAEREAQREAARRHREVERARAAQEREAKRREAQEERERRAEEKRRAAEDRRRGKEAARAALQQERAAGRTARARAAGEAGSGGHHGSHAHAHAHGPPEDCELEHEALLVRARATAAAQAAARGLDVSAVEPVVGPPPEFPPPYLQLQPAFPAELGDELGQALIEAWGFMACLADLLGAPPFSMEALLAALQQGSASPLLGLVHVLLLRQAQADMEEAHATGVLQSPQIHLCDRTLVAAAQRLEEAWAWGLDPDLWRAHLGPCTWPEVLRQHALASGAGGSRFHLKPQPAAEGPDGAAAAATKKRRPRGGPAAGFEGEDIAAGGAADGPLKLQLPQRFAEGTWMAAAWRVLAGVGPEGMYINDLVREISDRGLRDLSSSKNPEASLTGALSREVLFTRLKPGTYALQSVAAYHQRMAAAGKPAVVELPADVARPDGASAMDVDGHDDDDDEEESDGEEEAFARSPEDPRDCTAWAAALKHGGYDALSLQQRLEALLWLAGAVNEGPGVRLRLEGREKEAAALRKQLLEDARAEKRRRQEDAARRQEEAAARQRTAAAAAQRHLEELQVSPGLHCAVNSTHKPRLHSPVCMHCSHTGSWFVHSEPSVCACHACLAAIESIACMPIAQC